MLGKPKESRARRIAVASEPARRLNGRPEQKARLSRHAKKPFSLDTRSRLRSLLVGFGQIERARTQNPRTPLARALEGYLAKRKQWATSQASLADGFNLFEVLNVEADELRHSRLLAWILDQRIEQGTHAQGNLGFKLFLEEIRRDVDPTGKLQIVKYADESYRVRREVSSDESRVDIEIAATGKFIIHIEVKIDSTEGPKQTERELRDLYARSEELQIPATNRHGIFITLDGSPPMARGFHPIGWGRIADVMDRFAGSAIPPEVRLFCHHCAGALHKLTVSQSSLLEAPHGEKLIR